MTSLGWKVSEVLLYEPKSGGLLNGPDHQHFTRPTLSPVLPAGGVTSSMECLQFLFFIFKTLLVWEHHWKAFRLTG